MGNRSSHAARSKSKRMCGYVENGVGCIRSSKGFSHATPICGASPRLILLPFGGIPNCPNGLERMLEFAVRFLK